MSATLQKLKIWGRHCCLFYTQKSNARHLGKAIAVFASFYLCLCVTVTNAGLVSWFLEDALGLDPLALMELVEIETGYVVESDAPESENRFQLQLPTVVSEYVLDEENYDMADSILTALEGEFIGANEMDILWDEEKRQEFSKGVTEFVGEKRPPLISFE